MRSRLIVSLFLSVSVLFHLSPTSLVAQLKGEERSSKQRLCFMTVPWPETVTRDAQGGPRVEDIRALDPETLKTTYQTIRLINTRHDYYLQHPSLVPTIAPGHEHQVAIGEEVLKIAARGLPSVRQKDIMRALLGDPSMPIFSPPLLEYAVRTVFYGGDHVQAELWAAVTYAQGLLLHNQHREVWHFVSETLRDQRYSSISLARRSFDKFDAGSYYSPQTLIIALRLLHLSSYLNVDSNLKAVIAAYRDYSDLSLSEDDPARAFAPHIESNLNSKIAKLGQTLATVQDWERPAFLRGAVGYNVSPRFIDLYFNAIKDNSLRCIRYDKIKNTIGVLGATEAAALVAGTSLNDLRSQTGQDLRLFSIAGDKSSYTIQTSSGFIRLTSTEIASLRAGTALPADHALTQFLSGEYPVTLYSDPLMRLPNASRSGHIDFAFVLQRAYPGALIQFDDLTDATQQHSNLLWHQRITTGADVSVVTARASFNVNDWNLVANMTPLLRNAGISVTDFGPGSSWTQPAGRTVIVITGHANEQLADFIRQLGEAGVFRDNVVVFNTCQTPLSEALSHEINERYGAVGTFSYAGAIPVQSVARLLRAVIQQVNAGGGAADLWRMLTLRNGLNGAWTICENSTEGRDLYAGG
jgi:hypothetical protein